MCVLLSIIQRKEYICCVTHIAKEALQVEENMVGVCRFNVSTFNTLTWLGKTQVTPTIITNTTGHFSKKNRLL